MRYRTECSILSLYRSLGKTSYPVGATRQKTSYTHSIADFPKNVNRHPDFFRALAEAMKNARAGMVRNS